MATNLPSCLRELYSNVCVHSLWYEHRECPCATLACICVVITHFHVSLASSYTNCVLRTSMSLYTRIVWMYFEMQEGVSQWLMMMKEGMSQWLHLNDDLLDDLHWNDSLDASCARLSVPLPCGIALEPVPRRVLFVCTLRMHDVHFFDKQIHQKW